MGATMCVTKYTLPVDVFASNIILPVLFVFIFSAAVVCLNTFLI